MTPAVSILGQLSHGPCNASSLACYLHRDCNVPVSMMYEVFFSEIKKLIESNKVEHNQQLGYYRLTTNQCPDSFGKDDDQ